MGWEARPEVLDRERSIAAAEEIIQKLCPLLEKIVNYGTNVFVRCWATHEDIGDEHLGVLFSYYHLIEMLDAAETMFACAVFAPATLQLRSCFENLLYIYHIVERDSYGRGLSYLYCDLKNRIAYYRELQKKHETGLDLHIGLDSQTIEERISRLEGALVRDKFAAVRVEYENTRERLKRTRIPWYSLFSTVTNICELARHFGWEKEYVLLYRRWSRTVHGQDLYRFFGRCKTGEPAVRRMRDYSEAATIGSFAITFGIKATRKSLGFFRPGELFNFERWYDENIRPNDEWLRRRGLAHG
jgi:hypothetical protein